jgi:hypothetical protein
VFLETETGAELQAELHIRDLESWPLAAGDGLVARWSPDDVYFIEN